MRKVCEDCHKSFNAHDKQQIRCPKCQEEYRKWFQKEYHKEYWNDKPNTHQTRYYKFWQFCKTLSDDERRALVSAKIRDLRHNTTDEEWKRLRTEIKILCLTYEGEKETVYELREQEKDRIESVKKGVEDE